MLKIGENGVETYGRSWTEYFLYNIFYIFDFYIDIIIIFFLKNLEKIQMYNSYIETEPSDL